MASRIQRVCAVLLLILVSTTRPAASQQPKGPLTEHFINWLVSNGYERDSFDRPDIGPSGSYGGRMNAASKIYREPVIFVHGTGDAALRSQSPTATGWSRPIQYFLEQNYTTAELYATTWGDAWSSGGNILDSYNTMHTCAYLIQLRRFVEAVINYTGALKIDVIAHSVGVPLARKVLKGGDLIATDGNCSLGTPLGGRVDTFLGIAGPNYGLCVCQLAQTVPAWCNALDGLYPGYSCEDQMLCGYTSALSCEQRNYSAFLEKLNRDARREADYVYAMWSDGELPGRYHGGIHARYLAESLVDEVLTFKSLTWGRPTSRIPNQNGRWISDRLSHNGMKDFTELRQYEAVSRHSI